MINDFYYFNQAPICVDMYIVQLAAILIATLANIILRMIRSSKKQISFKGGGHGLKIQKNQFRDNMSTKVIKL